MDKADKLIAWFEEVGKADLPLVGGKGAFRRFKDVLARYPEERERWFRFKDERMEQRALEWLEDIGISLLEE